MIARSLTREEILSALEQVAQNGIPGQYAARILDVGSDRFLGYFEEEVQRELIHRGGATVRFFEGAYGSGKTHLLSLLKQRAMDGGHVVCETELSGALSLEDWQAITKHVLANIQAEVEGETHRSLPNILAAAGAASGYDADALLHMRPAHPGFKEAIYRYMKEPRSRGGGLLRDFLLGERVGAGQLRVLGIRGVKNPLSARNAESILRTVTAAFHAIGFFGTLLLFDENEQTFVVRRAQPTRRIRVGANLMRRLIDSCTTGSLVATNAVFAVLPGFLNRCAEAYPALGQRLFVASGPDGGAWRTPVLNVAQASTVASPEEFLEQCVVRYEQLARQCGHEPNGLAEILRRRGTDVLESNAGSGYRRPLMKSLASTTLQHLEHA